MKWQTKVDVEAPERKQDYHTRFFLLGSCFTENTGRLLAERKFSSFLNPMGIQFNPVSMARVMERLVREMDFAEQELFLHQGLYRTFDAHSSLSREGAVETIAVLNGALAKGRKAIADAGVLVLTPGTAIVHRDKQSNRVVANNHKLPAERFERTLLTVDEVAQSLQKTIQLAREKQPALQVILTLSPVRHSRNGLPANSRSKAILLEGIWQCKESMNDVAYFPSFEIMMDELRDYRFYDRDMVHPSQAAIDHIWERFSQWMFDDETQRLIAEVEDVVRACNHRLLHPASSDAMMFRKRLAERLETMMEKHPHLDFTRELNALKSEA